MRKAAECHEGIRSTAPPSAPSFCHSHPTPVPVIAFNLPPGPQQRTYKNTFTEIDSIPKQTNQQTNKQTTNNNNDPPLHHAFLQRPWARHSCRMLAFREESHPLDRHGEAPSPPKGSSRNNGFGSTDQLHTNPQIGLQNVKSL